MYWHKFNCSDLAAVPWRNGGGSTTEIVRWPLDSGFDDFTWRASIAAITADGPFSTFEQVDRIITLLEGPGVRLHAPEAGIDHRLEYRLQPYAFPGEAAVDCSMLGAPSLDFNVMSRRPLVQARLKIVRKAVSAPASTFGLLLAAAGRWTVNLPDGSLQYFQAGQGAWWHDVEPSQLFAVAPQAAGAALLWLGIEPKVNG